MNTFLEASSKNFVMSEEASGGAAESNSERWIRVLEHCKEAHETPLYGNFTEAFERAYSSNDRGAVRAYFDLADLRGEYFYRLYINSVGMAHVNEYEMTNSQLWSARLADKELALSKGLEKVSHKWEN